MFRVDLTVLLSMIAYARLYPILAAVLPLASKWRKTAWMLWLFVIFTELGFLSGLVIGEPFFRIESFFERKLFSFQMLQQFVNLLGTSIITLGFWLYRKPWTIPSISLRYRITVILAAYLPMLFNFAIIRLL